MSIAANRALWRKLPEQVLNERNFDYVDEVVADNYVEHTPLPPGYGNDRESVKRFFRDEVTVAFPDLRINVQFTLADEDGLVAGRMTLTGTHLGTFAGIPATGKSATWTESHFGRIVDGKVTEHWADIDLFGMLAQLGVIPKPQPAEVPQG